MQVESYLEELLTICQRSEEYSTFLLDKMREEPDQQAGASPANLVNSFKTGPFNLAVQELVGYYITYVTPTRSLLRSRFACLQRPAPLNLPPF